MINRFTEKERDEAYIFAANLMVPLDKLLEFVNKYPNATLSQAADKFGVPVHVIKNQLHTLLKYRRDEIYPWFAANLFR